MPDHIRETFEPGTDHGGVDGPDGRGVRYLEWTSDPDPTDTTTMTTYAFLFCDSDGSIRSAHETHTLGLFAGGDWLRFLTGAGFEPQALTEVTNEDRTPREVFVAHRPRENRADGTNPGTDPRKSRPTNQPSRT